jgi:phosphatidylserine synthase
LFSALTWLSVACGLVLLVSLRTRVSDQGAGSAQSALVFIVLGMLLALLSEFAVAPRIVARENLRVWHSMGTAMYALQWLCAAVTLAKMNARGQVEVRA